MPSGSPRHRRVGDKVLDQTPDVVRVDARGQPSARHRSTSGVPRGRSRPSPGVDLLPDLGDLDLVRQCAPSGQLVDRRCSSSRGDGSPHGGGRTAQARAGGRRLGQAVADSMSTIISPGDLRPLGTRLVGRSSHVGAPRGVASSASGPGPQPQRVARTEASGSRRGRGSSGAGPAPIRQARIVPVAGARLLRGGAPTSALLGTDMPRRACRRWRPHRRPLRSSAASRRADRPGGRGADTRSAPAAVARSPALSWFPLVRAASRPDGRQSSGARAPRGAGASSRASFPPMSVSRGAGSRGLTHARPSGSDQLSVDRPADWLGEQRHGTSTVGRRRVLRARAAAAVAVVGATARRNNDDGDGVAPR